MGKQAEAEREKRAKVIAAEGELMASSQLLDEVVGTDAILVFEHDPEVPAGTVDWDANGK